MLDGSQQLCVDEFDDPGEGQSELVADFWSRERVPASRQEIVCLRCHAS